MEGGLRGYADTGHVTWIKQGQRHMYVDNYKDIMQAERPKLPQGHPKMDVLNRAKIFSPFAALRGFEERIAEEELKRKQEEQI